MTRLFHIHVTAEDIAHSVMNDSYHCAVSTAIMRELPDAKYVSTDVQTIRFSLAEFGIRYVFITPPAVQQYVISYDAGDTLEPFEFRLTKPAWTSSRWRKTRKEQERSDRPTDTAAVIRTKEGHVTIKNRAPGPLYASGKRVYGLRVMRVNRDKVLS